jgi:tRNA-2-methylthio-N6-dimethylallyladenosine synthase
MKDRLKALQDLLFEQQVAFNAAQAGRTLNVLFDRKGRHAGQAVGRSPYLQSVHVDGADHLLGQIVPVRIEQGNQNSLKGTLIGS